MSVNGLWLGGQQHPEPPAGWTATWQPYDKKYSYLHTSSGYVQWGPPTAAKVAELDGPSPTPKSPAPLLQNLAIQSAAQNSEPKSSQIIAPVHRGPISSDGADVLKFFDSLPGHWSGRGQHVEFARNEAIPLEEGSALGRGASADVHEVLCRDFKLARKQIYCGRRMKIEDVRRELDILKKISHKHVVTLLGSYTQNKVLGILLYPAAACDLGVFLDEIDEAQRSDNEDGVAGLLERLGYSNGSRTVTEALNRLKTSLACLTAAVEYLHDNNIRHKDLKPRNILLNGTSGLFITDFGISRDNTDASTSVTNGIERGTYKYCAPEIARLEPRGRAADIYALGCVFLEIETVRRGMSLVEFDSFRTEDGDYSFQNSPAKLREWMGQLREIQSAFTPIGIFDILDIIEKMLAEVPDHRPLISIVRESLNVFSPRSATHTLSPCCGLKHNPDEFDYLNGKYKKVKSLFFDRAAQVEELQKVIETLRGTTAVSK